MLERTLYNGLLSGVSLDGKAFFYPNPLESNGQHERSPWFGVACCPGNITRFLPSLPGYVYAQRGDSIYVNLFIAGTADIALDEREQRALDAGDALPVGRRRAADRGAGTRRDRFTLRHPRARLGAATRPSPSDLYRFADAGHRAGDADGQRSDP